MPPAPADEAELFARAQALAGASVEELAGRLAVVVGAGLHAKGKVGTLLELALGASGGSQATWDFPELRVELKTVPVDERGKPRETTFVCAVTLMDADRAEWAASWVRAKLQRVLWVPIVMSEGAARRIGAPILWSPSAAQEEILREDFDEIMGRIGIGGIEGLSARVGRWLQLRPKAAHGRVRTRAPGVDGDTVDTVPRGFYLRTSFTGALLRDPGATPA